MQSIQYATKILLIWYLFYWRSFDEQEAHGPHLPIWVNSYKNLSMHFSLLVAMFLPIYSFGCHSNQSNSVFWTKCIYSVEDYASNISTKLQHICNELEIKAYFHFFPVRWAISLLLIYIICPAMCKYFEKTGKIYSCGVNDLSHHPYWSVIIVL